MGGLDITGGSHPAPWYEFELLNKSSSEQETEGSSAPTLHHHFKVQTDRLFWVSIRIFHGNADQSTV